MLGKNNDGFGDEDPSLELARLALVRLLECVVKGGNLLGDDPGAVFRARSGASSNLPVTCGAGMPIAW